jgi:hypothetical protein
MGAVPALPECVKPLSNPVARIRRLAVGIQNSPFTDSHLISVVSEQPPAQRTEPRMRSLCEAYQLGISVRTDLTHSDLLTAVEQVGHSIDAIDDGYPAWHPAPLSFRAMVLAFVIMETLL